MTSKKNLPEDSIGHPRGDFNYMVKTTLEIFLLSL